MYNKAVATIPPPLHAPPYLYLDTWLIRDTNHFSYTLIEYCPWGDSIRHIIPCLDQIRKSIIHYVSR